MTDPNDDAVDVDALLEYAYVSGFRSGYNAGKNFQRRPVADDDVPGYGKIMFQSWTRLMRAEIAKRVAMYGDAHGDRPLTHGVAVVDPKDAE